MDHGVHHETGADDDEKLTSLMGSELGTRLCHYEVFASIADTLAKDYGLFTIGQLRYAPEVTVNMAIAKAVGEAGIGGYRAQLCVELGIEAFQKPTVVPGKKSPLKIGGNRLPRFNTSPDPEPGFHHSMDLPLSIWGQEIPGLLPYSSTRQLTHKQWTKITNIWYRFVPHLTHAAPAQPSPLS